MRYKVTVEATYDKEHYPDFTPFSGEFNFNAKNMTAAQDVAGLIVPSYLIQDMRIPIGGRLGRLPWTKVKDNETSQKQFEISQSDEHWSWTIRVYEELISCELINRIVDLVDGSSFGYAFMASYIFGRLQKPDLENRVDYKEFSRWLKGERISYEVDEDTFNELADAVRITK